MWIYLNSYYLYTPMNLLQPENEIKGQLMATFEKVKGSEPVNPNCFISVGVRCGI